jgi:hypothetical protein
MIARPPRQGKIMEKETIIAESHGVKLIEIDETTYQVEYKDRSYTRRVLFFDWTSGNANYEYRAQEAGEHEK